MLRQEPVTDQVQEQQVQLARIEQQVGDMASMQRALMPKITSAVERIARSEEQMVSLAREQAHTRERVDAHDTRIERLALAVDRNTGWRGSWSKVGWALLAAALALGGKMVYDSPPPPPQDPPPPFRAE